MRALMVVLIGILALACEGVDLVPLGPAEICGGDLVEWELRGVDEALLVTDVQATPRLEITAPDGRTWHRAAFLYREGRRNDQPGDPEYLVISEAVLRIRHTPRVAGTHAWILRDAAGADLASGRIEVLPPRKAVGPIAISPHNPRLLAYADGTPFIPIGPNLAWSLGPDRLATFDRHFARLAEQGGTHVRLWLCSWCGQFEGLEPDAFDLAQAWLTDRIFALLRQHGLKATVVIDNHHDLAYGKRFPYGAEYVDRARAYLAAEPGEQYRRKLRYLLARWGADDVIAAWELFNEVDMACVVREISIPWIAGATRVFRGLDQDRRLLTVSWAGPDWDVAYETAHVDLVQLRAYVHEWLDVDEALRQRDRDGVGLMLGDAARANGGSHPFFFGESGYQGLERQNPGNDLDREGLLLRQQAWAGFLLGGCGTGMNWWWDVYIDANGLWGIYGGIAQAVAAIDWRDGGLVPLTPNAEGHLRILGWRSPTQALIWPQIRIDTWYHHLVEDLQRPVFPADVDLPIPGFRPGVYRVRWQHQVSGAVVREAEVEVGADGVADTSMPRDGHDLVVLITRQEAP